MPKLDIYRVKHHTEEAECATCGNAIYVGDLAHMTQAERIYCSRRCAAYEASNMEHERAEDDHRDYHQD